jgi:hypothetical protein
MSGASAKRKKNAPVARKATAEETVQQPTFDEVLALANAQDAANASASPAVPNILGLGLNLPSLPAGADSLSAVPWWIWGLLLGGGALLVVKVLK